MKGHYIGSYEDLYMLHCQKIEEMKSDVRYFFSMFLHSIIDIQVYYLLYYIIASQFVSFISQQAYKADYEDIKTRCFFPQTVTPEYEASKKVQQCSDVSGFGY